MSPIIAAARAAKKHTSGGNVKEVKEETALAKVVKDSFVLSFFSSFVGMRADGGIDRKCRSNLRTRSSVRYSKIPSSTAVD